MSMELMNLALKKLILEETEAYLREIDAFSTADKQNTIDSKPNYIKNINKELDDFLRTFKANENGILNLIDDMNYKKVMKKAILDMKNSIIKFKTSLVELTPNEKESTI